MPNIEYEGRFLDLDIAKMKRLLKQHGGKKIHTRKNYIRIVLFLCSTLAAGYARIRDEAGVITMTSKIYNNPDFPEEYEIKLDDTFDNGYNFLLSLGLTEKAFQESYREKWSFPDTHEIVFDIVPGIPEYMEIDCSSESKLKKIINLLGLDIKDMHTGPFSRLYKVYYGIERTLMDDGKHIKSLTFGNIYNELKDYAAKDTLPFLKKMAAKHKSL